MIAAGIYTPMVDAGLIQMPYMVSFAFLAIVATMSYQLMIDAIHTQDYEKELQQAKVYSAQFHAIYSFPRNIWLAMSATYFTGERTTINDVIRNDLQQNWRTGFTLALPFNRNHSIKLFGSRGISTRTGNNYDTAGIAWQYRWGGGI